MESKKQQPKKPTAGSVTAGKSKLIRAPHHDHPDIRTLIAGLTKVRLAPTDRKLSEEWETLLTKPDLKESDEKDSIPALLKPLVRTMFKADHPYRTRLGQTVVVSTSAAGVVGTTLTVGSITSCAEWSSINALFDELFVHKLTVTFHPRNDAVGTFTAAAYNAAQGYPVNTALAAVPPTHVFNCGLFVVALFNGAASYTVAQTMLSNPTVKQHNTGRAWKYVWRNNTRFDPRGTAISAATTESFQGWTLITNAGNLGGSVNWRAINDLVLGDGGHTCTYGDAAMVFDVSFRARA